MLLDCVGLFMAFVLPMESELLKDIKVQKCAIVGDKINASSIQYKPDNKEQWTRACKHLLTNLQYLCTISKLKDELNQRQAH